MIKDYESMIILKPQLNQDEAVKENEKIIAFYTENGGEFIKTDTWGKRQLAYPINKSNEGYYFINYFRFESENVKTILRFYNIHEHVLRYIIVDKHEKR